MSEAGTGLAYAPVIPAETGQAREVIVGIKGRVILVAVVAVALGVSACSVSVGGKKYDRSKVEAAIVRLEKDQSLGVTVTKATCPDSVKITEGVVFDCSMTVEGVEAPVSVTLTDVDKDEAHIKVLAKQAIISVEAADTFVKSQLPDSSAGATVDCSKAGEKVIVADVGTKITCRLALGDQTDTTELTIKDLKGTVEITG